MIPRDVPPRVLAVIKAAADSENVTVGNILNGPRTQDVVRAKRKAAIALRAAGKSLPQIGRFLGGMHHTSIINLLKPKPREKHLPSMQAPPVLGLEHDEWI